MVTMAEIDAARDAVYRNQHGDESGALVDFRQQCVREEGRKEHSALWHERKATLDRARAQVEALLVEWHKQGCREVDLMNQRIAEDREAAAEARANAYRIARDERQAIIDSTREILRASDGETTPEAAQRLWDTNQTNLRIAERNAKTVGDDAFWVRVGKKRYDELCEASRWMQSAFNRLVAACGGPASGGRDMVDEVIGLLRVTREQRDDAAAQLQRHLDAKVIARADHLLKQPRCACDLHELPGASYVDDHLGHHKAKRCTLTFNRAPSEIRPFVVVAREKTAPETSPKTCGNCRDWIPGGAITAATCTLYKAPRSRDDEACHRFITGG